jgi:hypothetical protein
VALGTVILYEPVSKQIDETIAAYRDGRLSKTKYLQAMRSTLEAVRSGHDTGQPKHLGRYQHASACYLMVLVGWCVGKQHMAYSL